MRWLAVSGLVNDPHHGAARKASRLDLADVPDRERTLTTDAPRLAHRPNTLSPPCRWITEVFYPVDGESLFFRTQLKCLRQKAKDVVVLVFAKPCPRHVAHNVVIIGQVLDL